MQSDKTKMLFLFNMLKAYYHDIMLAMQSNIANDDNPNKKSALPHGAVYFCAEISKLKMSQKSNSSIGREATLRDTFVKPRVAL